MVRTARDQLVLEIGDEKIPVVVSHDGEFWAEWEGDSYKSTTFKGLREKLLPLVRVDLKRCAIPAMLKSYDDDFRPITLVGIHASNGNALYLDADGKTHQTGKYSGRVYRPLTPAELHEFARLTKQVKLAERRVRDWLKPRAIAPGAEVRKALGLRPEPRTTEDIDHDEEDD